MQIAVLLYDNFTALDCVGPYEILSRLPGAELTFVAKEAGLVRTDTRALAINADAAIADVPHPDILLVPGGPGDKGVRNDPETLAWITQVHETSTWTTSVCTGSLILAAAGLLDGLEATTHWARMDTLTELGAKPVSRRVVREGKIMTAAGVSAGIDMALTLTELIAGEEFAQALQLGIEYDPDPPFDTGSPEKAPAHIVDMVREFNQRAAAS